MAVNEGAYEKAFIYDFAYPAYADRYLPDAVSFGQRLLEFAAPVQSD